MKTVLSWVLGSVLLLSLAAFAVGAPPSLNGGPDPGATPLAELGQRADQQQAPPPPVIEHGLARLEAPVQALRGRVGPEGLRVESTAVSEGRGEFRLAPSWLATGGPAVALSSGAVSLRDSAVVLDRGAVEEVYTTVSDGLRQTIIVKTRPAGPGDLTLTFAVQGTTVRQIGKAIILTLPGKRKLLYHGLKATAADGNTLTASADVRDQQTLILSLSDLHAQYPVTFTVTITNDDWFPLGTGLNGSVSSLAVASDGALYAGGSFTQAGGVATNHIARWDGSAWSTLGMGTNGIVNSLAIASDGALYAGGDFTQAGGVAANHIARWDGSVWSPLGMGTNGTVNSLAVASDGALYAGGSFTQAGGVAAKWRIAYWDGTVWSAPDGETSYFSYNFGTLGIAPDTQSNIYFHMKG